MILYISYKKNAVKKRRLPAIYAEKRDLSSAESRFAYEQTAFHFGAFAVKQSSGRRMARVMSRRVPAMREFGWYRGILSPSLFRGGDFYFLGIFQLKQSS